jgi:hypothetical protein
MAKGQMYHLTFTKIFTLEGEKLFVAASNLHGKSIFFNMKKNKQNRWKIFGRAPMWVRKAEAQLENIIKQQV